MSLVAVLASLWLFHRSGTPEETSSQIVSLELFQWFSIPGSLAGNISIGLRFDALSAAMLFAVGLATTCTAAHIASEAGHSSQRRAFSLGAASLLFVTEMMILSSNIFQFFLFWQLAMLCGYLLKLAGDETTNEAKATSGNLLVNRGTDLFLLFGLFLIWNSIGTFEFSVLLGEKSSSPALLSEFFGDDSDPQVHRYRLATISLICLSLLGAVIGRCAQFPLLGRISGDAHARPSVEGLLQTATVMPAGLFLIARCSPLFAESAETRELMTIFGCITTILTAMIALTRRDLGQSLSHLTAGFFGWMLIGMGAGSSVGLLAALFLLLIHTVAMLALFLVADQLSARSNGSLEFHNFGGMRPRMPFAYCSFLVAAFVLVSGLWGQNAILSSLGGPDAAVELDSLLSLIAAEPVAPTMTGRDSPVSLLDVIVPALAAASLLLTAFALSRAFLLIFHHRPQRSVSESNHHNHGKKASPSPSTLQSLLPLVLAATAALLGPLLAGPSGAFARFMNLFPSDPNSDSRLELFAVEFGSLLVMIGIVAAWMMYAKPTDWPMRCTKFLAPLARLSSHRFYFDDVYRLFIILPTHGAVQLCRLVEWLVLEGVMTGIPARFPRVLSHLARPLQMGVVQFYGLSLVLTAALLLAVVSWLKG